MVGSTSSQLPDLGFIFYPPKNADSPGYPRLDIILREKPTGRHIDPEQILVSTISKFTGIETIKIVHPWTGEKQQIYALDASSYLPSMVSRWKFLLSEETHL
ncbi:MAG: hypothetical protein MUO64_14085 [Anaerolineales bacterium]|jgi:hypothetical protein|nr:hypothetical protein [Anaerolineales bacterium]